MALDSFHPAVAAWFRATFPAPTAPQVSAWPAIQAGRHVLIAAPTGSGKTLAAFLAAIDALVREGLSVGLSDTTHVVYVSPLKALSNDIKLNLETPLAGIRAALAAQGLPELDIRILVRTGDTPQAERERMRRRPPHIVVTTPESLYILLTSESGRRMLATTRTVIVDEIHAIAQSKRGSHLTLSLERLQALAGRAINRVGLSATQKPIGEIARFLVGNSQHEQPRDCTIIDTGHARTRDLAIEVPPVPLEAVMANQVWELVYGRLAELILLHRTTLVFVNTRRMVERVTRHLAERLGEEHVAAHHGSLAKEARLDAEQRLKNGKLKALVATASLELGIDIGEVDMVCQLGSPRSIAAFLQRVGRSGHAVGGTPRGRLFPQSRDDLVECAALIDCVRRGELDRVIMPEQPLDVLAQQMVAEVACREWGEQELFELFRRAHPYRGLSHAVFMELVHMLAEGFATRRGRQGALLHYDAVNGRLRGRRGARLTAITCGGTIPDNADYQVILEPEGHFIGTVNEDFAVESLAGDVFQLGNHSYRILRVEAGRMRVEDAHGATPNIPFWIGEAPGRSDELSAGVARLRQELAAHIDASGDASNNTLRWLIDEIGIAPTAAQQLFDYLAAAKAALTVLPSQHTIVLERFFDEAGGTQLVIHSPFGSHINRAWGLALRKRFCRKFNFELQAAATEDAIILSLTTTHSFDLEDIPRYLHANSVRPVLIQALLDAPMFTARWRWNATTALALPRFRGGKKVPAPLARMNAEDLITAVFPEQLACAENIVGEREVPDHPLVNQTIKDCLTEAMDIDGLIRVLRGLEGGDIGVVTRDLTEPSPLALEILNARPYAFLDDAPLEERRTQAVMQRRWLDPAAAADIGRLDPAAIRRVQQEAWPDATSPDELHDALLWLSFLTDEEVARHASWSDFLAALAKERRATCLHLSAPSPAKRERAGERVQQQALWIAAERLPQFQAVFPDARLNPAIAAPTGFAEKPWTREQALVEIVRGRLEGLGPVSANRLTEALSLPPADIDAALATLQGEGFAMSGRFTPDAVDTEWCERRLLARIHRYTVQRLRQEIEPVPARDFLRFLFHWQHAAAEAHMEGPDAVAAVLSQLEGFEAPAAAWEAEILPTRVKDYDPSWLDGLCLAGRATWMRLTPRKARPDGTRGAAPLRSTPIALLARRTVRLWTHWITTPEQAPMLGSTAQAVADYLRAHGASFFDELVDGTGMLRTQLEQALAELTAFGLINSDSFVGLRALLTPSSQRRSIPGGRRRRRSVLFGMEDAGRWALRHGSGQAPRQDSASTLPPGRADPEALEHLAWALLRRYGVVFWRLLEREATWLPAWRELLYCYRKLEARGEIRGGRFVAGFSGEQFALPDALGSLRELKRQQHPQGYVSLSGADPLNLVGIFTPGAKLPALIGNRVLYRDGLPIAILAAGEVRFLEQLEPRQQWEANNALLRSPQSAVPSDLV